MDTNFKQIAKSMQGGKVLWLYIVGQTFNIILTFIVVWVLLSGKFFPEPNIKTFNDKENKNKAKTEVVAPAKKEVENVAQYPAEPALVEDVTTTNTETK